MSTYRFQPQGPPETWGDQWDAAMEDLWKQGWRVVSDDPMAVEEDGAEIYRLASVARQQEAS